MKEYRKKLRRQIKGMLLFLVVSVAVIVICGVSASKLDDNAHAASFVRGFQAGIFLVWAGASVYGIVSNVRALKDERKGGDPAGVWAHGLCCRSGRPHYGWRRSGLLQHNCLRHAGGGRLLPGGDRGSHLQVFLGENVDDL